MKKAFLGVFIGMILTQAVMYGGQLAENKYQQIDGIKSKLTQNESKVLVFSREKQGARMVYRVSLDPNCDKEWLKEMLTKGKAVIKYQSAGKSKITIYDVKDASKPSPVLYVCIDKADTNVLGQLTVLKRKSLESPCYLNLPDPETVIKDLRNSDVKVAYQVSDADGGCIITVYEKEHEQYVCIQDSRWWTPGNYYEMGKVRGRDVMDVEIAYMPITVGYTLERIGKELSSLKHLNDPMDKYTRGFLDIVRKTYPKFQWDEVANKTKIGKYGRFTNDPEQLWPKGNYGAMGECRAYELKKEIKYFNTYRASYIIHYINWEYGETLRTAGQEEADKYAYGVNNEMMRPTPERAIPPSC